MTITIIYFFLCFLLSFFLLTYTHCSEQNFENRLYRILMFTPFPFAKKTKSRKNFSRVVLSIRFKCSSMTGCDAGEMVTLDIAENTMFPFGSILWFCFGPSERAESEQGTEPNWNMEKPHVLWGGDEEDWNWEGEIL